MRCASIRSFQYRDIGQERSSLPAVAGSHGTAYAIGGMVYGGGGTDVVRTPATPLPQGRWGLAAAVLPTNQIYAMGGLLADWASGTGSAAGFDVAGVGTFT